MSRISAYNQSSGRRQTNQIDNEVQIRQMDDILAEGGAAAQVDSREWDIDQELHRFLGRSSVPRSALRGNAVDLVDTVDTGFPPYANMVESERVDSCHGVVPWELSDGKSDKSACVLKHRTNCDEFGDTEHALSCLGVIREESAIHGIDEWLAVMEASGQVTDGTVWSPGCCWDDGGMDQRVDGVGVVQSELKDETNRPDTETCRLHTNGGGIDGLNEWLAALHRAVNQSADDMEGLGVGGSCERRWLESDSSCERGPMTEINSCDEAKGDAMISSERSSFVEGGNSDEGPLADGSTEQQASCRGFNQFNQFNQFSGGSERSIRNSVEVSLSIGDSSVKESLAVDDSNVNASLAVGDNSGKVSLAVGDSSVKHSLAVGDSSVEDSLSFGDSSVKASMAVGDSSVKDSLPVAYSSVKYSLAVGYSSVEESLSGGDSSVKVSLAVGDSSVKESVAVGDNNVKGSLTVGGYTIQRYYRTKVLLTKVLFGQRYYKTKILSGTRIQPILEKSQYLRYFN